MTCQLAVAELPQRIISAMLCPRCERYVAEIRVRNERTDETARVCTSCARLIEGTCGLAIESDLPRLEDMSRANGSTRGGRP